MLLRIVFGIKSLFCLFGAPGSVPPEPAPGALEVKPFRPDRSLSNEARPGDALKGQNTLGMSLELFSFVLSLLTLL